MEPSATHNAAHADDAISVLRVGILDRDSGLLVVLTKCLQELGWEHTVLPLDITPQALTDIEVLIVDLAVIGEKRWAWLRELCQLRPDLSIIVCTGSSTVTQRVLSLRMGVDDWLTKPCHPRELVARVEAITVYKRRRQEREVEPTTLGELEIRPDRYQAFVAGRSLRLTPREYQLIEVLARGNGEVLAREQLYEALWGREMARNARSVDVCVHKLRRKLELASPGWRYIETHYSVGYRLVAKRVQADADLSLSDEDSAETRLAA